MLEEVMLFVKKSSMIFASLLGPGASVSCAHCAGGVPQGFGCSGGVAIAVADSAATFNAVLWHSWSRLTLPLQDPQLLFWLFVEDMREQVMRWVGWVRKG
eukprot:1155487-Pelagomonas_calceolata.AAC.3